MCSYFIVGNKIFSFFKKLVFDLLDKDTFQGRRMRGQGGGGGSQVIEKFEGGFSRRSLTVL